MQRRRTWFTTGAGCAVLVVALLAGCAPIPLVPTLPPTAAPTAPAPSPTAPTPTPTTGPGPTGECKNLTMSLKSRPDDSGAGSFFWDLALTNADTTACSIEGYPTVFLVSAASGETIGAPAGVEPVPSVTEAVVPLAPGASAFSLLHLTQAGAYGCPIVAVTELAVTPPDGDATQRVATPDPIEGCDDHTTEIARVGPLAPHPVTF